ncbi:SMF protein [Pandoraea communis]|uniref:SMF protein n=1 Tax=Pandoraea communis TaxID=2508297 RepID=A0A5E4SGM5_9BURK|nr:DNA-processing protein DprA [Pandoraea communis]VVD75076.1 SMF protein [Pandoraea communis]
MKNFSIAPLSALAAGDTLPARNARSGALSDALSDACSGAIAGVAADGTADESPPLTPNSDQIGADGSEIKDWLRLCHTPGVPPAAVRRLLAAFGPPEAVFRAPRRDLAHVVPNDVVARLLAPVCADLATQIAHTIDWASRPGCAVVTLSEPAYPRALLTLGDAPPILYCCGDIGLPNRAGNMAAALVGSRRATPQGRDNARHFARVLGQAGVTVVSGLAAGIDAAAHEGALETAGRTCAVVGTGADIVYPARHRALAGRIAERGLLLSAFPIGTPPRPDHFPRRNRLIAALARCTVVVEAATHSGSLITARLAGELGRDVLAIPGSIHAPQSQGCHTLIRDGATLVTSPEDVFEALGIVPLAAKADTRRSGEGRARPPGQRHAPRGPQAAGPVDVDSDGNAHGLPTVHPTVTASASMPPDVTAVVEALGYDPVSADTLCERTGMGAGAVLAHLSVLELDGRIARLPGGRFVRLTAQGAR